jgi:hypothetical protein
LDKEPVEAFRRINSAHGQSSNFARELAKELATIRINCDKAAEDHGCFDKPIESEN